MNEDRLREIIKKIIHEVGVILLYAVSLAMLGGVYCGIVYIIYRPPIISATAQNEFNTRLDKIKQDKSKYHTYTDLYGVKRTYFYVFSYQQISDNKELIGNYKYDWKLNDDDDYYNLNIARQKICSDFVFHYTNNLSKWLIIILLVMVVLRYLVKFIRWLYPEQQK